MMDGHFVLVSRLVLMRGLVCVSPGLEPRFVAVWASPWDERYSIFSDIRKIKTVFVEDSDKGKSWTLPQAVEMIKRARIWEIRLILSGTLSFSQLVLKVLATQCPLSRCPEPDGRGWGNGGAVCLPTVTACHSNPAPGDLSIIIQPINSDNMKEFKCEVCNKTFRYLSLYERHKRIHSSQKAFKCEVCAKAFNRPDTLKTHMNIHSETGFGCCGRFFHSKAALKYHQKTVHSVKVFKCRDCGTSFQKEDQLEAHSETHNITEFPMLLDCITTEESNPNEEPCGKLIMVVDEGGKKHSIWSEADMLLSYIRV